MHKHLDVLETLPAQSISITVIEDAQAGEFGDSCIGIAWLEGIKPVRIRLNMQQNSHVKCWDRILVQGKIQPPKEASMMSYWRKGCIGRVRINSYKHLSQPFPFAVLSRARNHALDLYPASGGDGAVLIQSISFGYRSNLFQSDMYGKIKAVGLAHLVAVSGAHLSIVASAATILLRRIRIPRRLLSLLIIIFIMLFVAFVGAPPSALRAAIMLLCALMSFFAQRRASALSALALCMALFMCIDPPVAVSVSFALSAVSTLCIVLFARLAISWVDALLGGLVHLIAEVVGVTLVAVCATLPFSLSLFSQISLVSFAANLVALPSFSILCAGGILSACLHAIPFIGPWLLQSTVAFASLFCKLVAGLSSFPFSCVPAQGDFIVLLVIVVGCFVALYVFWPQPQPLRARVLCGLSVLVLALSFIVLPALHGPEIVMLDVGQGDAIVLRDRGKVVLIDTGNKDTAVLAGLARHSIAHIDMVVISHPDDDHCGSIDAILDVVDVGSVGVAADLLDCSCQNCLKLRSCVQGCPLVALHQGDYLRWGVFSALVAGPKCFHDEGSNDDSVVLQVFVDSNNDEQPDISGIFSGDAESPILDALHNQGWLSAAHIYKVAHHGSDEGASDSVLSWMQPRIALVSVGKDNRYGHPAASTIQMLQAHNVSVYRSDLQGDVVCSLGTNDIRVRGRGIQ